MVSIARTVEKIIREKPFIEEALIQGIINNAALAENLIPEVEKAINEKVKFSAVNMAIRRLSEDLKERHPTYAQFKKKSDITVKSNLFALTIFKEDHSKEQLKKIHDIINIREGDILTITQGVHEIMIIANETHKKEIKSLFKKSNIKRTINDLSLLTIKIPKNATEDVGLFYLATRELTWENINIIDIVSTLTEMTFVFNSKNVSRAFDVLQNLINKEK